MPYQDVLALVTEKRTTEARRHVMGRALRGLPCAGDAA